MVVAPVRERGLKYGRMYIGCTARRRSREGAWIEIRLTPEEKQQARSRSREGAWIEIA